ncbi:MAG: hypothetical protein FJ086_17360 [Deltaproteobacteria bacterium]|nr:hypothetical protein [Deltaproteobacteria bacterium]
MDPSSLLSGLSQVVGVFDPTTWVINFASDKLGLDGEAKNLVRVIAGVVTFQPQTVLGGALGLLGEHLKEQEALAELPPVPPGCTQMPGYAPPPPPRPPSPPGGCAPPPGEAHFFTPLPLPPPPGQGNPVAGILQDPSLCLEEKIARIVDAVLGRLDQAILGKGEALSKSDGQDREKLIRDLQRLMEQRRQMNDLASNSAAAFHGMCMTAIQNMRG